MLSQEIESGLIKNIYDSFKPYIQELWKDLNFGLCRSKVDIDNIQSSSNDINANLADQFTLALPYAGSHLKWEVMFDAIHPWYAPDFRFDDESFLSDVNADFIDRNIPSLAKWNAEDPKALSNVIAELMNLYRKHQTELLSRDKNSRPYFEYSTLVEQSSKENDVEILIGKKEAVNFMIKLDVDCTELPTLFSDNCFENPGGECAVLLIKYPNPSRADLIMSPLLTRVVGDLPLPQIREDAILMDYVPYVTELIDKKISSTIMNKKRIQEFLSGFVAQYEGCVIEHDSKTASFLFEHENLYCLLHIEMGMPFPEKCPTISLESIYHMVDGRPHIKVLSNCPENNITEYLSDEFQLFFQECQNL